MNKTREYMMLRIIDALNPGIEQLKGLAFLEDLSVEQIYCELYNIT